MAEATLDQRLDKTVNIRLGLIDKLTASSNVNLDDRDFLIKLLDGTDRTVLSINKIRSDENISKDQQEAMRTLASDILLRAKVKKHRTASIPDLTDDFIPTNITPGETLIGSETIEYDMIMKD